MNSRQAISANLDMGDMVCTSYINDLSDDELMLRPHAQCNHIKWQLGHLIASENQLVNGCLPGTMPELPDGFAEKYTKETCASDDAANFHSKEEFMEAYKVQRAATKAALESLSDDDLDKPSPESMQSFAPTVGHVLNLVGAHWMMHAGQWVVVRRETGKEIVI